MNEGDAFASPSFFSAVLAAGNPIAVAMHRKFAGQLQFVTVSELCRCCRLIFLHNKAHF